MITLIGNKIMDMCLCLHMEQSIFQVRNKSAIALSSTKAEHRGAMNATTQCLWLQGILGEFGIDSKNYKFIYCENQSSIWISTDPVMTQKTKHIDIHMHYIRGLVNDGVIDLQYCPSSEQVGNIFTKVV